LINNIYDQLKRDEGFRSHVYKDTVGKSTIGYGHNLDAHPLPYTIPYDGITLDQADAILREDVHAVTDKLTRLLPWSDSLSCPRFCVLVNMAFNMGVEGLVEFHHMLSYAHAGDYANASLAMTQSKWYNEVGERAARLVQQMALGVWQ